MLPKRMTDILFTTVEKFNAPRPWGRFLDSGTGVHSLEWIDGISTTGWTAVTADKQMKAQMERDAHFTMRPSDQLVVGNWMDESFTRTLGKYDTILADYLIGAVDGFSPYAQDVILDKLKDHLNPNGRLYLIGMNPIPDHAPYPAEVVTEVRRARDSCILLAGHRPYREFPLEWITRHLERSNFKIVETRSEDSILRQLKVAQSKLYLMPSSALKSGMESYLNELSDRVKAAVKSSASGRIPLSSDYVIAAELCSSADNENDSENVVCDNEKKNTETGSDEVSPVSVSVSGGDGGFASSSSSSMLTGNNDAGGHDDHEQGQGQTTVESSNSSSSQGQNPCTSS